MVQGQTPSKLTDRDALFTPQATTRQPAVTGQHGLLVLQGSPSGQQCYHCADIITEEEKQRTTEDEQRMMKGICGNFVSAEVKA